MCGNPEVAAENGTAVCDYRSPRLSRKNFVFPVGIHTKYVLNVRVLVLSMSTSLSYMRIHAYMSKSYTLAPTHKSIIVITTVTTIYTMVET